MNLSLVCTFLAAQMAQGEEARMERNCSKATLDTSDAVAAQKKLCAAVDMVNMESN